MDETSKRIQGEAAGQSQATTPKTDVAAPRGRDGQKPLLSVRNLHVSFDTPAGEVQAVRGVSFDVYSGETFALVGESGSGKSVTASSVMRLNPEPPSRIKDGSIELDGIDIVHADEKTMESVRGKLVGMVFQDPMTAMNPTMRVGRQIGEVLQEHDSELSRRDAEEKAVRIIGAVRIPDAKERAREYPNQFSGGMRQRALIGMSIANVPKLLIADEPTTALDVTIQAQVINLLSSIQKSENMAMIFITHDLGVTAQVAHRIAVMYAGKVVEQADAHTIYHHPAHPYTIGLLQSVPDLNQDRSVDLYTINGAPPQMIDPPKGCAFASRCARCMRICHELQPPETDLGNGHTCSCWLLDPRAKSTGAKVGDSSSKLDEVGGGADDVWP